MDKTGSWGKLKTNENPKKNKLKFKSETNTLISPFLNKFGSPMTQETKKIKNKSLDCKGKLKKNST